MSIPERTNNHFFGVRPAGALLGTIVNWRRLLVVSVQQICQSPIIIGGGGVRQDLRLPWRRSSTSEGVAASTHASTVQWWYFTLTYWTTLRWSPLSARNWTGFHALMEWLMGRIWWDVIAVVMYTINQFKVRHTPFKRLLIFKGLRAAPLSHRKMSQPLSYLLAGEVTTPVRPTIYTKQCVQQVKVNNFSFKIFIRSLLNDFKPDQPPQITPPAWVGPKGSTAHWTAPKVAVNSSHKAHTIIAKG